MVLSARCFAALWCAVLMPLASARRPLMSAAEHERQRERILREERTLFLGGDMQLSEAEEQAERVLMAAKYAEVDEGFANVSNFNPAMHFFHRKASIEASRVFRIIRSMPKGAVLHAHDTALLGSDYLLKVTYQDNLYACFDGEDLLQLRFAEAPPAPECECEWKLLRDERQAVADVAAFDRRLVRRFTLVVDDPEREYKDINDVWDKFNQVFALVTPMLTYRPVWENYNYEALKAFREDNVMYLEFRSTLPDLYDLNGTVYDVIESAKTLKRANDRFLRDFPDSFGSRLIYAPLRGVSPQQVAQYVRTAVQLKQELGEYFAGFDLVGQEDAGAPLKEFLTQLVELPADIDVFYHSGETNWFGTSTDTNLIDAMLFGAKRLGHAYALLKHPAVAHMVRERDTAVEVSPLSNQILLLVKDLRNHPASIMLAEGLPVVVSSDDPGLWGALPLSHDLYEAFVGMADRHAGLRLLKRLALNSLRYSCMQPMELARASAAFTARWDAFIVNLGGTPEVVQTT